MTLQFRILPLAMTLALPGIASAQAPATELDEVVVTATRTSIAVEDSLVPIQVIGRAEIERSQASSVQDLLRGRAGINLGNQGGPGKLTALFLRGSESDHVLVLVDGVRYGSATSGQAAFQDLPVELIERIEIVRGPRSSLYGSDAIGGVIHVFTRRDQGSWRPHFRLGVGSHGLREASAGFGGSGKHGWFGADIADQRTDGINACRGSATLFAGCYADEPDRDGYRNTSLNLRGGWKFSDALSAEGNALRAEGENEYDGSWTNYSETLQQVIGGKLRYTPSARLAISASLSRGEDRSDDYLDNLFRSTFQTKRDSASVQADFGLAEGQLLTAGVDWQDDKLESTTVYSASSRDNSAVFVQYQGSFGAQRLQASLRNDDNQQFGNHSTGSLGWGMELGKGLRLTASYATGFKAPTFNDLYYPGSESPWLRPELSKNLNLGIAQHGDRWNWTFNVFDNRIDDLIVFVYAPPTWQGVGTNLDWARLRGAELTFDTRIAGWKLSTQLSHLDPRNHASGYEDKLLPRRARNTGRIDLDRDFGDFRMGTTLNGAGQRYDDLSNQVRLAGYATLDLRVEYALSPAWTLQARANNVFNRDYETVAWYHQPGREYGLSVRYHPVR